MKNPDLFSQLPGQAWGVNSFQAYCANCGWQFLLPESAPLPHCPNCMKGDLTPVTSDENPGLPSPELFVPARIRKSEFTQAIQGFASGFWFPPSDLNPANLTSRAVLVYLPMWLVDSQVVADWKAEMGYHYQVMSHQDNFDDRAGGWRSNEVEETRIRWETRIGLLDRTYQNIAVSALVSHRTLMGRLGNYDYQDVQQYLPENTFQVESRWMAALPDRASEDAWPEAIPILQAKAQDECRQAADANHIRDFQWTPGFPNRNFSLLLLPMLTTYYLDDQAQPCPVFVNAQNGKPSGTRKASWQRARKTSIWLGAACVMALLLALVLAGAGMLLPPLLAVAGLLLLVGVVLGLGALAPLIIVWSVNRH